MTIERFADKITVIALLVYSHRTAADVNVKLVFLLLAIVYASSFIVACLCAMVAEHYKEDE